MGRPIAFTTHTIRMKFQGYRPETIDIYVIASLAQNIYIIRIQELINFRENLTHQVDINYKCLVTILIINFKNIYIITHLMFYSDI
jgi:hypothetical protein